MIQKLASLFGKALPAAALLNKAKGVDPRLNGFISTSILAGYGADKVLSFLQDKISGGGQEKAKQEIQSKGEQALPHERAAAAQLQGEDMPRKALAGLAGLATGGVTAAKTPAAAPPTAKSVVEGMSSGKGIDPQEAYNAFAEAGYSKAVDFLSGKASGDVAFASLQKFTGQEFMDMISKRFGAPAQQISDLALQFAGQKGELPQEQAGQVEQQIPEAAVQQAQPGQVVDKEDALSAENELLKAIQNLRNISSQNRRKP